MGKLIRLELFNFKSYKGHHVLLFGDSYFTSIVGPNGSGKSNSMDAISFVLGIKSSHLRSTQLRDLVYRGRVLKHSTIDADGNAVEGAETQTNGHTNGDAHSDNEGATRASSRVDNPQTAWVMAVYEDEAGEEQRWKRSITATGQSEYRINNRVVTAREYNDTLEAEKILIKARNFLVFQGDVEAIASQSPRDLTRLIEQISGSLECKDEYDRLKVEAEKANEDAAFKLNQRRAMNSEIKQYQAQKEEAEKYEQKIAARDNAIVTHVLWKLHHLQMTIEESGAEIQRHQEELKESRRNVEKYEKQLEDAKRDQAKASKDVSRVERTIRTKEKDVEEKESSLVPIDEKLSLASANLQKYQSRIAEISKERDSQTKSVDRLKKDLATVDKAQQRWEKEWKAAQQQQGKHLSDADLMEYNQVRSEVTKKTANEQTQVDGLTRSLKTDEETTNSLKSKLDATKALTAKLEVELQALKDRRNERSAEMQKSHKSVEETKKELSQVASERRRTEQKRTELDEKLQDVLYKLSDAEGGRRESERESRAKETLAGMKRIFPGVKGRIHELCKPKQKKFETAVAIALGRHWDSIVVDTEQTARDCIQYLKDQRAGQGTFIPLDSISVKGANANLKGLHKGMRLTIDTIEYDSDYDRAMSYACGNSMVCDDLKVAKYICYEKGVEATAVTLDGTKISKGGLMTGGRSQHDKPRRWEDAEVEGLRKLKSKFLAELKALSPGYRRGHNEEFLQGELAGLDSHLDFLKMEVKSLDRNLQDKKKELAYTKSQLAEVTPKYDQHAKGLEHQEASIERYQKAISAVEDTLFASFCKKHGYKNVREYEAQQGSLQQEALQKKLEFSTQKSKLENQLSFETQRLGSTEDRIKRIEDQSQRDLQLIKALAAEKEIIREQIDSLNEELETLNTQQETLAEKANEKAEKVAEQRREVQKRSKDMENELKQISDHESVIQRESAARYSLLRKCRIEEIKIPLMEDSEPLTSLPMNEIQGADPDAMEVDEDAEATGAVEEVEDYGIEIDFDGLDDDLKEDESSKTEQRLKDKIENLSSELEKMAPNLRATDRLESVETRLRSIEKELDAARRTAKQIQDNFENVKDKRLELFNKAFNHISEQIGATYKDLTRSAATPLGGQAYLDNEEPDEPYLAGLKYHAMPPLKRFRDMEHLSGGEKTMAALALLFAVHSYQPSPFFVLDEVDAALDNANVAKLVGYIKRNAGPGMQFIVISLKAGLFEGSETLVGVMRDQTANSSKTLTLDLRKYQP